MRWNHNASNKFATSFKWHLWFAWRPVSDGNTIVWREWVWRKKISASNELIWIYNFGETEPTY